MFKKFLKRFFSKPSTHSSTKAVTTSTTVSNASPVYEATATELAYVTQILKKFEELGLEPNQNFELSLQSYANAVVEGYPEDNALTKKLGNEFNKITHYAPFPELTVLSCYFENLARYQHYFNNALLFTDHCFDGESCENHFVLVQHILAIAKKDWQVELISVTDPRFTVSIKDNVKQSSLTIEATKDFDLKFFQQLNSLIPTDISGRFGYAGDGGHILVVWLPEDAFPAFNAYCGIEFYT